MKGKQYLEIHPFSTPPSSGHWLLETSEFVTSTSGNFCWSHPGRTSSTLGPRNTSKVALSENFQTSGWRHSNKVKVQGATGSNKDGEKKLYTTNPVEPKNAPAVSTINFSNKKTKRPTLGDSILIADLCESTKKDSDTELKEQRNSSSASFPEDLDIFKGPSLATLNIAISTLFWGLSYGIMHNTLPSLSVWHHLFSHSNTRLQASYSPQLLLCMNQKAWGSSKKWSTKQVKIAIPYLVPPHILKNRGVESASCQACKTQEKFDTSK